MKLLKSFSMALTLALALSPSAQSGNIQDIKGTWNLLKPTFRAQLSPVCGALGIEFKYIEKLYHFGNPDDATVQLIKQLFHAVPGGFMPSQQNLPSKFFSMGTIGSLLTILTQYHDADDQTRSQALIKILVNDPDFLQATDYENFKYYNELKKHLDMQKLGELKGQAHQKINAQLKDDYKELKKCSLTEIIQKLKACQSLTTIIDAEGEREDTPLGGSKRKRDNEKDQKLEHQPDAKRLKTTRKQTTSIPQLIEQLTPYAEREELAKKFNTNDYKTLDQKITEFCELLIKADHECKPEQQNIGYRPYTPNHALLAWAYKNANSKADFVPFFQNLNQDFFIEKQVIDSPDWQQNVYENQEKVSIDETFTQMFQEASEQTIFETCSGDLFADVVFTEIKQQFHGQPIPVLPEFQDIHYEGIRFADCVETTVRNLCNILTYDQKTKTFGTIPQGLTFSEEIKNFYKNQDNASEAKTNTSAVRESWSNIVQNLPNITYGHLKLTHGSFFKCPDTLHGFIKLREIAIPEATPQQEIKLSARNANESLVFNKITINDCSYLLVPDTDEFHLYELMPSARNIILIMNHLFNMNLFNSEELKSTFFSPTFGSSNFKKLCTQCGWTISHENLEKFDREKQIFGPQRACTIKHKIPITVLNTRAHFILNILPLAHAFAQRPSTSYVLTEYQKKLKNFFINNPRQNNNQQYDMLFDLYRCKASECGQNPYFYFTQNLFDTETKRMTIHSIITTKTKSPMLASLASKLISSLELTVDLLSQEYIARTLTNNIEFVTENQSNQQLINTIEDFANNLYLHANKKRGLLILQILIPVLIMINKHAIIIRAASENSTHEDWGIRNSALELFSALIDKNQGFDAAICAASQNSAHPHWDIRNSALELFRALFDKNEGFHAAITAATQNITELNAATRISALELFVALFKKSQGFDAAITAATQNSGLPNGSLRASALELFIALVNKGQGFDTAITIATKNSAHRNWDIRNAALGLFTSLVKKNQGLHAAMIAAIQNSTDQNSFIRESAIKLLIALIKQNYQPAYERAKEIKPQDKRLQTAIQEYEKQNKS